MSSLKTIIKKNEQVQVTSVADDGYSIWIRDGFHGGVYRYSKTDKQIVDEIVDPDKEIYTKERVFIACDDNNVYIVKHNVDSIIYVWNKKNRILVKRKIETLRGKIIGLELIGENLYLIPFSYNDTVNVINTVTWNHKEIYPSGDGVLESGESWGCSKTLNKICSAYFNTEYILYISLDGEEEFRLIRTPDEKILSACLDEEKIFLLSDDGFLIVRDKKRIIEKIKLPQIVLKNNKYVKIYCFLNRVYFLPIVGNTLLIFDCNDEKWETVDGAPLLYGLKPEDSNAEYWYGYCFDGEVVLLPFRHNMIVIKSDNSYEEGNLIIPYNIRETIFPKDSFRYKEMLADGTVPCESSSLDLDFFIQFLRNEDI